MRIKVERRVSLTPRDLFLLNTLYENVVLSFTQVCRKAFSGKAKSTVLNRLGKLEGMGVIERWRVPVLDSKKPGPGIFVVFCITRKGIGILAARQPDRAFRQKPIRLHGFTVHHDVLLVDVMDALRERFQSSIVTNGKLLGDQAAAQSVNPDAVLELPEGKERWAVELELTPKSEKRYREIVLRYRLQSAFARVLYVTTSREVVQKLARVLDRMPEKLGANQPLEKFLWLELNELLPPQKCSFALEKKPTTKKEITHE
jgi:DNA-binding MarR family transcriptional regulator